MTTATIRVQRRRCEIGRRASQTWVMIPESCTTKASGLVPIAASLEKEQTDAQTDQAADGRRCVIEADMKPGDWIIGRLLHSVSQLRRQNRRRLRSLPQPSHGLRGRLRGRPRGRPHRDRLNQDKPLVSLRLPTSVASQAIVEPTLLPTIPALPFTL